MKLVIISDTHGQHEQLELPAGDVLIHCGDWSPRSSVEDTIDFTYWFDKQEFKYKICVAGNHDRYADSSYFEMYPSIQYLQDDGVEIEGIKFWGMPWTPTFFDWFWMRDRGPDMKAKTDLIPLDTNVLITHGPQDMILDRTLREDEHVGCQQLGDRILDLKDLQVHCFGHIHEQYGKVWDAEGQIVGIKRSKYSPKYYSVNASVLNERYQLVNDPIVVEL